jgi:hypothetical protein
MSVRGVGSLPACGTRYVAPYKRDFRRGSRTGGFLRALRFPLPSKGSYSSNVLGSRDTVAAVLSLGRVARISQAGQPVMKMLQNTKIQKYKNTNISLIILRLFHFRAHRRFKFSRYDLVVLRF